MEVVAASLQDGPVSWYSRPVFTQHNSLPCCTGAGLCGQLEYDRNGSVALSKLGYKRAWLLLGISLCEQLWRSSCSKDLKTLDDSQ